MLEKTEGRRRRGRQRMNWLDGITDSMDIEVTSLSRVQLFVTPWTVAHQASPSMEFSRHEYWSGLPHPPAGDLPYPGIIPASLIFPALVGRFFITSAIWEDPG